jgi:hypothetical protein
VNTIIVQWNASSKPPSFPWLTVREGPQTLSTHPRYRHAAEPTRQAALSLGTEADHGEIIAWAHEMRAWINLTTGDYNGVVVAASREGTEVTPHHSVAVQLFAQEAKAWARMRDRRQTEVALDNDRRLLESLPYQENLDHHFVVDPAQIRLLRHGLLPHTRGQQMAENLADEVIQASTDFDGKERAPGGSPRPGLLLASYERVKEI